MENLCKSMPKLELHAHLNGSISEEILERISLNSHGSENKIVPSGKSLPGRTEPVDLAICFATFAKIHELITTPRILEWVTKQVIEDFWSDNVVYLELRTTPKMIHSIASKDIYIESVVRAIIDSQKQFPIIVKLLISIDRKLSVTEAEENVRLAIEWSRKFPEIVVGMELSGDPTKGSFPSLLPSLQRAKDNGLQISLHLPEVVNVLEAEQMLQFRPHRVGHGVNIHPENEGTQHLWETLLKSHVPVEVCLTSNILTKCSNSLEDHHVKYLREEGAPFVICTDDSGVFRTTLSQEYQLAVKALELSEQSLKTLCLESVEHAFANSKEKLALKATIDQWWEQYFKSHSA